MRLLKHYYDAGAEQPGGGGRISDEIFGPSWNGVTGIGASKNALYDYLITIGAGFGNTAFVRLSGNDTTAILGNFLLPYATIGAAVAALGVLPNSALYIDAGTYTLNDINAPFGLRAPGSQYDIFLAPGCQINYVGSYGAYISDRFTLGNVYGSGRITSSSPSYSGSVDGVNDYSINIGVDTIAKTFQALRIAAEDSTATAGCLRIGTSFGSEANFFFQERIQSRGGPAVFADFQSRGQIFGNTYIVNTNQTEETIIVSNPIYFRVFNCLIQPLGYGFGRTQNIGILLDNAADGIIEFDNCLIQTIGGDPAYSAVSIVNNGAIAYNNIKFRNCQVKNFLPGFGVTGGVSFSALINNISFKIVDTYVDQLPTATITNIIATGSGLAFEPNI